MARQEAAVGRPASPGHPPCEDQTILDAASEVIVEYGYTGLTLARVALAAGTSRMTLHRRGLTVPSIVGGLSQRAAAEWRDVLFPVLSGLEPADVRLRSALVALCEVADRHLPLLAGLFAADDGIFHTEPDEAGALATDEVFVAPLAKLLAEGASDGSLAVQGDSTEVATVLFNVAGWGYVQLRHAQRWPAARAREGVMQLVLTGLLPKP